MADIFDVANWFLSQQSMTHKKLQKLCYYAQAWHCALYKTPLYKEEVQAWVHGPVVPTLYSKYSDYKWEEIPNFSEEAPSFKENNLRVLEAVYNTYGSFSGDQLELLSHSEDPWINAREGKEPWEPSTAVISTDSMKDYYSNKYEESQND